MDNLTSYLTAQTRHSVLGVDLIRAYLGIALFVRGVMFLTDPSQLSDLTVSETPTWLANFVTYSHLIGGLMLAVGLFTRIAALIQVPVLFGAVFVIHFREGLLRPNESFELSSLVLFILLVFVVFGAGRASVDYYLSRRRRQASPA